MDEEMRSYWDAQAAEFDNEPDHGLRDPAVRAAWAALLLPLLPKSPATVADLGCGTGSLSVLLAAEGYAVSGLDLSEPMVELARSKAAAVGASAHFEQGDAAAPPYAGSTFDVVLARHVLWALPDPAAALERWVELLRPDGRLVLIEGRWHTGSGLSSLDCQQLVHAVRNQADVVALDDPALWGGPVDDERYLLTSPS